MRWNSSINEVGFFKKLNAWFLRRSSSVAEYYISYITRYIYQNSAYTFLFARREQQKNLDNNFLDVVPSVHSVTADCEDNEQTEETERGEECSDSKYISNFSNHLIIILQLLF